MSVEDDCHESVTSPVIHHWDPPYTSDAPPYSNGLEYGFHDKHKLLDSNPEMNSDPEKPTLINYKCAEVSKQEVQSTETESNPVESYNPSPSSFDYILKRLDESMGPQVVINGHAKPEVEQPEEVPEEPTECIDAKADEVVEEEVLVKMKIPEMGENKTETPSRRVMGRGRARRRAAELCQDL